MKNITKSLLILLGIFTISCSNDDVEDRPVIIAKDAPVLSAPADGSIYTLAVEDATKLAERFVWTSASFDTDVAITYSVELDLAGKEFANPQALGSVIGQNNVSVTVESLNGAAIAAGGEAFAEGQYEIRIKASVNSTFEALYSNVVTVTIKPYLTYPFKDMYLVGSATATGWDNAATLNMYAMYRDGENANVYHYTGYFAAGEFKLIREKGKWAPSYGLNGGALAYRATEDDPDTSNIPVATAGYYTLTVDVEAVTYTLVAYNATGATVYPTIGIIGTSTPGGWDNDTDMTKSTFDEHIWYINKQALTAGDGKLKFRANDAWDVSWGSTTSYSGLGTLGGADIPIGITANGNYDIWFNDLTGRYIYIPVK
ncbi:hypothetical protein D3C87_349710 [compost metagenome]